MIVYPVVALETMGETLGLPRKRPRTYLSIPLNHPPIVLLSQTDMGCSARDQKGTLKLMVAESQLEDLTACPRRDCNTAEKTILRCSLK